MKNERNNIIVLINILIVDRFNIIVFNGASVREAFSVRFFSVWVLGSTNGFALLVALKIRFKLLL